MGPSSQLGSRTRKMMKTPREPWNTNQPPDMLECDPGQCLGGTLDDLIGSRSANAPQWIGSASRLTYPLERLGGPISGGCALKIHPD